MDHYRLRGVVESVKDVTKLDPHKLFVDLFKGTLEFRLKEDVFSRVRVETEHCTEKEYLLAVNQSLSLSLSLSPRVFFPQPRCMFWMNFVRDMESVIHSVT